MAIMTAARCPKCQIEVGTTWRWCLACGYDPDGSAQRVRQAAIEARQRQGGWIPVLVVMLGLAIGGGVLWKTTPDDTSLPTESPSTAAEVSEWVSFSPPAGGFKVDLPAQPMASTGQTSPTGQPVQSYGIGSGDHLFTVTVLDTGRADLVPGHDAEVEAAMRANVDQLAGTVSGEVTVADVDATGPPPRLDFRIEHAAIGELRGRVVVLGSRLVTAVVSSKALSDEIADHVVESLGAA
jgi:hypothetical protein